MWKNILLPIAGVMIFIVIVGLFSQRVQSGNFSLRTFSSPTPSPLTEKQIKIADNNLTVEIAKDEASRQRGLGGRSQLASDHGMLFVFDTKPSVPSFWMKDMLIPLDIIWIMNGKVIKIDKDVPAPDPGTQDQDLKVYSPDQQIDYVLEVNGGYSDKNSVKVGTAVDLSQIN